MIAYENLSGTSNIRYYHISEEAISLTFKNGVTYEYNYDTPGAMHVENMKTFAIHGLWLNRYVVRHVGSQYHKHYIAKVTRHSLEYLLRA
ncbi:MAG: hypothetical protein CMC35_01500 [Flavobacteriaceae bacterium]|nr:hypothetical protein [Flavobacteriaceae bacterium]|tara:strand:- start:20159 stop:20428 length:270 start_codon:yes stop_codon:yes gene_type:complete